MHAKLKLRERSFLKIHFEEPIGFHQLVGVVLPSYCFLPLVWTSVPSFISCFTPMLVSFFFFFLHAKGALHNYTTDALLWLTCYRKRNSDKIKEKGKDV